MSDREFENYLALLGGMLRLRRTQRESIAGELRDHLIEHVAQLEASGSTHEEAVRRALEEFGDAAALAANFSALVGMRRRRLIMRCTIGTTVVMTGLVVALLAFRPEVRDDPNVAQAQAKPERGVEKAPDSKGGVAPGTGQIRNDGTKVRPRDPDQRTRLILKEPTDVDFAETPLTTVLDFLSDQHKVPFYIDNRSFKEAGVDREVAVTLNLSDVPLEMVLDLMFRELGLGYRVRNGVVVVGSEDYVQSQTDVRVYPVPEEDAVSLLLLIAETIEPHSWRANPQVQPAGMAYGQMSGGRLAAGGGGFGEMGGGGLAEPTGFGDPEGPGSIRAYRGVLVVSQTPEVHQKIEKLLTDLERVLADRPRRGTTGAADPRGLGGVSGPPGIPAPIYPGHGGVGGTAPPGYGSPASTPPSYGVPPQSAPRSPAAVPGATPPGNLPPSTFDPGTGTTAPATEAPTGSTAPSATPRTESTVDPAAPNADGR